MIISRRKLHLVSSIALAIILPIIFVAGLIFRPSYDTISPATEQLLSYSDHRSGHRITQSQDSTNSIATFLQQ